MKEKTYSSTFSFIIFSSYRIFLKKYGIDTHPIDLSCHQKFDNNLPTGSGKIDERSWKNEKSHSRLDPTLRIHEIVHARVPTLAKPPAFHPGVFSVKKRYFSVRSFYGLQEK